MSITQQFDEVLKEVITPQLKSLGFKKSGNNFYRDLGDIGQCFNVQQSRWNTADAKTFCFNIGLIHKEIYKDLSNCDFPKFPKEYDCQVSGRLGLLKFEKDEWYELSSQTDLETLKATITYDLITYVNPFFLKYAVWEHWYTLIQEDVYKIYGPFFRFLLLLKLGKKEEAQIYWNNYYNECLIPECSKSSCVYPNGIVHVVFEKAKMNWERIELIKVYAAQYGIDLK